jgi:ribosomal protein S18 acetylase RimI-like enzyme
MGTRVETGGQWPQDVERILRSLPEWFGMEDALLDYVASAATLPSVAAVDEADGAVVGVCLVRHHTPVAAEIDLLAVLRDRHRQGIGRLLVDQVIRDVRSQGCALLQVKTFGPSVPNEPYERTRAFYEAIGFLPLEERTDIWGPENPCLISVLPL